MKLFAKGHKVDPAQVVGPWIYIFNMKTAGSIHSLLIAVVTDIKNCTGYRIILESYLSTWFLGCF